MATVSPEKAAHLKAWQQEYYAKNKTRLREYQRAYYRANREKIIQYQKARVFNVLIP
jgi:hypothetical protein